jgi:REP-associated tyrosine transposase
MLFVDDHDRSRFVWWVKELATTYEIRLRAYCLLSTHYHLLLEGRGTDMAALMQRLNGRYARRYNERHCRFGHLFAERYAAWVVDRDEHLASTYAYIAANPVNAGLCENASDWPWLWFEPFVDSLPKAGTG